jgi:thiamine kinase-like enzyme
MRRELSALLGKIPGWDHAKLSSLYGGITNENFRAEVGGESYVLRLNGRGAAALGIDRAREGRCARIVASLGVGPEVVLCRPRDGVLITRFLEGLTLSPKAAAQPAQLRRIVAAIKRYHGGPRFPASFSPFGAVRRYHATARIKKARFPQTVPEALRRLRRIEHALGPCRDPRPCHNDLLASNFIDAGGEIRIVDWEYAAMGDPLFDLGNFAVNQGLSQERCALLLKEYAGKSSPKDLARLNLYRLASDMRETFWGILQSVISEIQFDFSGYGKKHLDRFLSGTHGPQFERWLREAGR